MVAHLASEQDHAGIENEGQVQHNVRQKGGSLLKEPFGLGISCGSQIENVGRAVHLGMFAGSPAIGLPAFQNSWSAQ